MTKLERISHYGIITVALSAVVVSIWQVRILQEHNKLSVKPLMDFMILNDSVEDGKSLLTLEISNRGIGPSIIQEITYTYKGTVYYEWGSAIKAADMTGGVRRMINYDKNTILSPDSELTILKLEKESYRPVGIQIQIIYQSIYEDEFELVFGI